MSWLRSTSLTLARQLSRSLDPRHDYEPQACYNSFCKHWQQANDIIVKSQPQHLHDDVLGVVNHLEQLTTLLVLEARAREINCNSSSAACLEYLLSENLLDKLYEWALCTGKYENAVQLEQLKLFGHLVSHYSSQVIAAEPFLRPLLKLLSGFRNQLPLSNLESQLVAVLNQLCVVLMQNMKFIDLFFLTTHTKNGSQAEFIIGRLLLSSVHREGSAGSVARDAFLLCAKMSARCPPLAHCLLTGNACPILATGLSGLYSLLPRSLGDTVKLTPDDVNRVHKLTLFIDSLEFCNAVAQLSLVTLSLMETLIDINCEDVMIELIYKYLLNGNYLMATYRSKLSEPEPYRDAAVAFLGLRPNCCSRPLEKTKEWVDEMALSGRRVLDFKINDDNRRVNGVHNDIAMNNLVHEANYDYGVRRNVQAHPLRKETNHRLGGWSLHDGVFPRVSPIYLIEKLHYHLHNKTRKTYKTPHTTHPHKNVQFSPKRCTGTSPSHCDPCSTLSYSMSGSKNYQRSVKNRPYD
ncbi:jg12022 [Pararge aegeria aegeria]|uniref:Jg12022 protein n=1 Tax=Pararge aegeria aegeria TaxID=348720 RepID=A0A8S4R8B5_9NEOP|nr:jg12022 [Pararge aegeria aegeria]